MDVNAFEAATRGNVTTANMTAAKAVIDAALGVLQEITTLGEKMSGDRDAAVQEISGNPSAVCDILVSHGLGAAQVGAILAFLLRACDETLATCVDNGDSMETPATATEPASFLHIKGGAA